MTENFLENLIKIIECDIFTVMWMDGHNYRFLGHKVYFKDDEAKAYFENSSEYIDLYNSSPEDFKFFRREIDFTNILEEMGS